MVLVLLKSTLFTIPPCTAQIYPYQNAQWTFHERLGLCVDCFGVQADSSARDSDDHSGSSIADEQGDLIFYMQHNKAWTKNHSLMPNGDGLLAFYDQHQTTIIVPQPGDSNQHYMFYLDRRLHIDSNSPNTYSHMLMYSKVDMDLNGGLGAVIAGQKNIVFDSLGHAHPLSAVHHSNNRDYWLIAHHVGLPPTSFQAFHISESGLNPTPVVSWLFYNSIGLASLASSPDGGLLAGFVYLSFPFTESQLFLAQFNRTTGQLSNPMFIPLNLTVPNSAGVVEFFPCGERLAVGNRFEDFLRVYDLSVYDSSAIASSLVTVPSNTILDMELALDGNIYLLPSAQNIKQLDRVQLLPNGQIDIENAAIVFDRSPYALLQNTVGTNKFGLLSSRSFCAGGTSQIRLLSCVDSAQWFFTDRVTNDTFSVQYGDSVSIDFDSAAIVDLHLLLSHDSLTDTVIQHLCVTAPLEFDDKLADTTICINDTHWVDLSHIGGRITWSNGSQNLLSAFSQPDTYAYELINPCGVFHDTFVLNVDDSLRFDLGNDSVLCVGDTVVFAPDLSPAAHFEWHNGAQDTTFSISQSDTLILTASNACGSRTDSVAIYFLSPPQIRLPDDTLICDPPPALLHIPHDTLTNYFWNDSAVGDLQSLVRTDTHTLTALNACGSDSHTITIHFARQVSRTLDFEYALCEGDSIALNASVDGASYLWSTGDTTAAITTSEPDDYIVSITLGGCETILSTTVRLHDCDSLDCKIFTPNVITPNADGVNDQLTLQSTCDKPDMELSIYNRWGQLVYHNRTVELFAGRSIALWDGYLNGEPTSRGVYYFTLRYHKTSEKQSVLNGSFQVLR